MKPRGETMKLETAKMKFPLMETTTELDGKSVDQWRSEFAYKAGKLYWKRSRKGVVIGSEAGTLGNGRWMLHWGRKSIQRKHAVWLLEHGWVPVNFRKHIIVHNNGDGLDDRWENLSLMTPRDAKSHARAHKRHGDEAGA